MPRTVTLPLLFATALFVGACGGDDAPTREEFAENASRICREAEQSLEQLGEGAETPEEVSKVIDKGIKRTQQAADELSDLDRPEGEDGETAGTFVEGFEKQLNDKLVPALEDLKQAIDDKDQQAVQQAAEKLQGLENDASDQAARKLGATDCTG
ncbi:MAG TPA: hypothetical protein VFB44_16050 [Thermoleophilaceae bacterium]|nr:hypothetical protein [Thermoleophilaceae bacterium]